MKTNFIILLIITILFSCKDKTFDKLTETTQELSKMKRERDSVTDHLNGLLTTLEQNLKINDSNQNMELSERIKKDVDFLESSISENEKKIKNYSWQAQKSRNANKQFEEELQTSRQELEERQQDLESLNQQIVNLDRRIKTQDSINKRLINVGSNQARQMDDLNRRLNTAYVIVGKFKELRNKELVEKKGGFLNLFGRVPKIDPDYNRDMFAVLNIRKDTVINLELAKNNIRFVSTHPAGSYQLIENGSKNTQLEIKDPQKFWEASKFLVILNE